jgi:hypothetical protein
MQIPAGVVHLSRYFNVKDVKHNNTTNSLRHRLGILVKLDLEILFDFENPEDIGDLFQYVHKSLILLTHISETKPKASNQGYVHVSEYFIIHMFMKHLGLH